MAFRDLTEAQGLERQRKVTVQHSRLVKQVAGDVGSPPKRSRDLLADGVLNAKRSLPMMIRPWVSDGDLIDSCVIPACGDEQIGSHRVQMREAAFDSLELVYSG